PPGSPRRPGGKRDRGTGARRSARTAAARSSGCPGAAAPTRPRPRPVLYSAQAARTDATEPRPPGVFRARDAMTGPASPAGLAQERPPALVGRDREQGGLREQLAAALAGR